MYPHKWEQKTGFGRSLILEKANRAQDINGQIP